MRAAAEQMVLGSTLGSGPSRGWTGALAFGHESLDQVDLRRRCSVLAPPSHYVADKECDRSFGIEVVARQPSQ